MFGFLTLQLLGELDATVELIESRLIIQGATGQSVFSPYLAAIEAKDPILCAENHVVLGLTKKDFMERSSPGVLLSIAAGSGELHITAIQGLAVANYQGRIQTLVDMKVVPVRSGDA